MGLRERGLDKFAVALKICPKIGHLFEIQCKRGEFFAKQGLWGISKGEFPVPLVLSERENVSGQELRELRELYAD